MSFWSSLKNSFGGGSSYDQKGADANYGQYSGTIGGLNQASNQATSSGGRYSNQLANTNYMAGAQNAYKNQLSNYGQQQGAASMLYNQASGNVASAADMQMQAGLANANNQAQSAAYSQQGGVSPGLTQRNMLNSQAQQNASIVNQGAQMRAQETAAGQQAYGSMLSNMGQTAANMTNQQQNMGQFAYDQGQSNLQTQNQLNQQNLQFQQGNATSLYGAKNNQINAKSGYQSQQDVRAGNTASAFMGSLLGGGAK